MHPLTVSCIWVTFWWYSSLIHCHFSTHFIWSSLWTEILINVFGDILSLNCLSSLSFVNLFNLSKSCFLRCKHCWTSHEIVSFWNFIIFIWLVELCIKLSFSIIFIQRLTPINTVILTELIEFIKFNKCHSKSIETRFHCILLPIGQLDFQFMLNELEKIIIGELILMISKLLSQLGHKCWFGFKLLSHIKTKFLKSKFWPPIFFYHVIFICHSLSLVDDVWGVSLHSCPYLNLVVSEVDLISALSFKINIEPFSEFTSQNN